MALPSQSVTSREFDPTSGASVRSASWHTHLVVLDLCGERCAIELRCVREINPLTPLSRPPASHPGLEGVIDVRGHAIPVHDIAWSLGHARTPRGAGARLVIVDGDHGAFAFIADRVCEIVRLDSSAIERALEPGERRVSAWARLAGERIPVIDPHRLVEAESLSNAA